MAFEPVDAALDGVTPPVVDRAELRRPAAPGDPESFVFTCSFTVCSAPSRPSQPLIAARLLPDAGNGIQSLATRDAGQVGPR